MPKTTTNTPRRHVIGVVCAALCAAAASPLAWANDYPNKPVKLVVPYPPGGPTDIVARVVAQKLQEQMGQSFFIENRPGAGANIGAEAVARSPADGYTLVVATTAHAINPSLFAKLSYSITKDFASISQLTSGPLVIVTNPATPANNVKELIALAKSKQGGLNYASSGNGQSTHLSAELFNAMGGVKMAHVPYKGSAPALTDVMGGQADLMFDTMLSSMPHVKAGKLKALAVTSSQRSPSAPGIPTVAESGLPGYEAIAWNGLLAPAGTPKEVVDRLSAELKKVLDNPEVAQRFEAQGFAAAWSTPTAYAGFLQAEVDKWGKVVKASGARID
ncbi:tripartite tricarboxylate transporter substrate binding protein [Comamonas sp. CMM02]|uniref:tripartite tricarboxylate transporter substrate binding protein n=1 Tax=Comamonas sp. CMM02 TaxID=2769307 RepID=UPI00178208E6|nr:tripartite tricarboxylate transporter substrate binding protein [Comamonas sp. CMM02]MBD9402301.1 tripartite tricarboxylate transporter substrate binding protein [Comamonas sp. CMM02]